MVDVLVDMMEVFATVPDGNFVLTQGEGERLFFIATIAEQMTRKVKDAYYALEDKSGRH